MSMYSGCLEQLFNELGKMIVVDEQLTEFLTTAWNKIQWPAAQSTASSTTVSVGGGKSKSKSPKKKTPYGLFMKSMHDEMKGQKLELKEKNERISTAWKGMSDADKEQWAEKAKTANESAGITVESTSKRRGKSGKGTGKTNGYILYVQEQMPTAKDKAKEQGIPAMKYIAELWKQVSKEEKEAYKAKAAEANAAAASSATTN